MYPDLSYFFHDLFGTEADNWISIFKTFGFILVVALMSTAFLLKSELLRLEREGKILPQNIVSNTSEKLSFQDIALNTLFTLFIGGKLPYIIANFDQFKADPASIVFSSKGQWVIGIILGLITLGYYLYKNNKASDKIKTETIQFWPSSKTNDIIIVAGISGVIGSKLFSVFEDIEGLFRDPISALFSGSGLNVFGGIILAFFVVSWYVKKLGIKPIYMMDIGGMGILLGYAVGRIGCQLSGDGDWGIIAAPQPSWWFLPDWIWSYDYPNNVNNDGVLMANSNVEVFNQARATGMTIEESCKLSSGYKYCHILNPKVYPTPLYEIFFSLLALAIIWFNRLKFRIPGLIFFTYMIINGVERFFIETIRVNERYEMFGLNLSQAQYISILFVIIGIAGIVFLNRKHKSDEIKART